MEKRTVHLVTLRLSESEYSRIRRTATAVHEKMSTVRYVTQMALHGYYVQCGFREISEMNRLLLDISESLNKAETGPDSSEVLSLAEKKLEEVKDMMRVLLESVLDD